MEHFYAVLKWIDLIGLEVVGVVFSLIFGALATLWKRSRQKKKKQGLPQVHATEIGKEEASVQEVSSNPPPTLTRTAEEPQKDQSKDKEHLKVQINSNQDLYQKKKPCTARISLMVKMAERRDQKSRQLPLKTRILLCIDKSGSMKQHDKYPLTKSALREFVKNLPEDILVSILYFSDEWNWLSKERPVKDLNIEKVLEELDQIEFGPGTFLAPSLREIKKVLARDRASGTITRVAILSDGILHDGPECACLLKTIMEKQKGEVRMIGLGCDAHRQQLIDPSCPILI